MNLLQGFERTTVLVVDDDRLHLSIIQRLLGHTSAQVDFAHNGMEAYNVIEVLPYDLVITDFQMPFMAGDELIRKTRKLRPQQKFIAMTANTDLASTRLLLEAGADRVLHKPIHFNKLLSTMHQLLRSA